MFVFFLEEQLFPTVLGAEAFQMKEGIVPCLGGCKGAERELEISSTGAAGADNIISSPWIWSAAEMPKCGKEELTQTLQVGLQL